MEVEHVDHLVDERAHGDVEIRTVWMPDDDELVLDAATASHCERGHRVFQPPVSHGAGRDQLSLQSELRYAASQLVLKQPVVYRVEHQMHVVVVYVERLVRVPQRVLERRLEILDDTGLFGFKYWLARFHVVIYSPADLKSAPFPARFYRQTTRALQPERGLELRFLRGVHSVYGINHTLYKTSRSENRGEVFYIGAGYVRAVVVSDVLDVYLAVMQDLHGVLSVRFRRSDAYRVDSVSDV